MRVRLPSLIAALCYTLLSISGPLAARADVSVAIGGALAFGEHTSVDGTVRAKGAPLPAIDLDADSGRFAFHGESIPYEQTGRYGDRATFLSRLDTELASFRAFTPDRRSAVGIGYGATHTTVNGLATPGTVTLEANGLRIEGFERFSLSPRTDLDVTLGGIPRGTGTVVTDVLIPGARVPRDRVVGTQIDATIRAVTTARRNVAFEYGLRYLAQTFSFATSSSLVERNAVVLPFAEVRLRL